MKWWEELLVTVSQTQCEGESKPVCLTVQMGETAEDYIQLRGLLNLGVLRAELQNTDESLQSLR